MAAPAMTTTLSSSMDALRLSTLDVHLARWCSSSSLSTTSSASSCTDCPTLSKSLTDSMSSDTQTENDTPPESPEQNTPVIRDAARSIFFRPAPRALAPADEAGYETESEDKRAKMAPLGRRRVARDRRRGERRPPPAPAPAPAPTPIPRRTHKAPVGVGLGLGLPSTLSAVRRAPNCAYRSNMDAPAAPRFGLGLVHADTGAPLAMPPPAPRLAPRAAPRADPVSPLALGAPLLPAAPARARHASFCFSRGGGAGRHPALETLLGGTAAAAFVVMAAHAQLPSRARGSRLAPVCEADEHAGARVGSCFPGRSEA